LDTGTLDGGVCRQSHGLTFQHNAEPGAGLKMLDLHCCMRMLSEILQLGTRATPKEQLMVADQVVDGHDVDADGLGPQGEMADTRTPKHPPALGCTQLACLVVVRGHVPRRPSVGLAPCFVCWPLHEYSLYLKAATHQVPKGSARMRLAGTFGPAETLPAVVD
jgi:hypothetical protein